MFYSAKQWVPQQNFVSVAQHIVSGPLTDLTGLDVEHDMLCLRRWWCTMLVENLEIEGHGRRFAHFTEQGIQMARGSLDPIFRIPRKRKYDEEPVPLKPCKVKEPCRVESSPEGIGILQVWYPKSGTVRFGFLVPFSTFGSGNANKRVPTRTEPYRTARWKRAITCTHFWKIVREESFLKEAHFCWLDSVVNWNSFSEEYKRTYRIPYLISRCIQCDDLYKDCEGYWGSGQRGKLQGFYSENDFAGNCMHGLFLCGWRHNLIFYDNISARNCGLGLRKPSLCCLSIKEMAETHFFSAIEMTTVGIYVVKDTANSEPSDVGIVIEGVVALRDLENVALASAMLFGL
ncbi:unnamed protein product [Leuciscus chuanchicus]